jgi:SAM-dependent methyltransferase
MKSLKSNLAGHLDCDSWRPEEKLRYVKYFPMDVETVLDVGCGLGELLWVLKNKSYKIEGCDADEVCIERAKKIIKEVKYGDAQKLTEEYPSNSFDLVTCLHVLEHLPSPYEALNEMKKVTKKYVLLAVPNARYITFEERETHLFSWNRITLRNLIENAGFKMISSSEDWTNVIPNVLPLIPFLSKILLRLLYDPVELIMLIRKEQV